MISGIFVDTSFEINHDSGNENVFLKQPKLYDLAKRIFPICRSLTGEGVVETLEIIRSIIGNHLRIERVPSGTRCFDWTIPNEWWIKEAYIKGPDGKMVVNFRDNNLHVVNYSQPIHKLLPLDDLKRKLHFHKTLDDAIPYITSYYKKDWGFCLTKNKYESLLPGEYEVFIDSGLFEGHLSYGEILIPGECEQEILLSTYICHPSMGNNEVSGPVVTSYLTKWIMSKPRRYSYRIIFIPETIGSICYLSRNIDRMKKYTVAGYNVTCVGDSLCYSFLPSRRGNSISDRVAKEVLSSLDEEVKYYSYLDRGSDERQYCSPGVDLPISTIMRSKYGCYPEYHTSLDDLSFISQEGLFGSYNVLKECLTKIESLDIPIAINLCEPNMGSRNLYPKTGARGVGANTRLLMNILAYSDGHHSLKDISEITGSDMSSITSAAQLLRAKNLIY